MVITIIGTGYVGSVAGACFAENGHKVVCVDKDKQKVAQLSRGNPVIYEPGLNELLQKNISAGRLSFTDSIEDAIAESEIIFMTVGTPSSEDGSANLKFLEAAVREVGRHMQSPKIIVNKSTVPIGTHRKVANWLMEETEIKFDVVSNPEFLREGAAVKDFLYPERVVIGTKSAAVFEKMKALYSPFVKNEKHILHMDTVSAELTKYACNAFLATRISFMNDLAQLCERVGGDIQAVQAGMRLDARIGQYFLNAGLGYGGSCFPKDIRALIKSATDHNVPLEIVSAVERVNEKQKKSMIPNILKHLGKPYVGKKVTIWGLAFKPQTDDIREAPALILAEELISLGIQVNAYDPVAMPKVREDWETRMNLYDDPYEALEGSNALIIATEWPEFHKPDFDRMIDLMEEAAIFDGRNILQPEEVVRAGFKYWSIGRRAFAPVPVEVQTMLRRPTPVSPSIMDFKVQLK